MSRDSLANAKAELFGLLSQNGVPTIPVKAVYDFEPGAAQALGPNAVTIFTAGMDPDSYHLGLRLYQTTTIDARQAQVTLDSLIFAVEDALKTTSGFGPSRWTVEYNHDIQSFVAECVFEVGREDMFR